MKFGIVDPSQRKVRVIDTVDLRAAQRVAELDLVDHGSIYRGEDGVGLCIVVYEFGLCQNDLRTGKPIEPSPMFGFHGGLYAGNCVLYSYDAAGETIDLVPSREELELDIIWLPTQEEAERAITCGLVRRPIRAINDEVLAAWPKL